MRVFVTDLVMGTLISPTPRGILRLLLRFPIVLYRLGLGWLFGNRFLLLTHVGRKSGMERSTVLEVVRHDRPKDRYFIASGWGKKAQWYRNVAKNPNVRYTVGARTRTGLARPISTESAEQELREYGRRHPRALRKLVKMMLGEVFEDNDEQYRRLSKQVPMLEISPNGGALGAL